MQEYLTNWRYLVFKSVQISSGRLLSPKFNVNKYTVLSNMEYLINLDKTGIRLQFPTLRM